MAFLKRIAILPILLTLIFFGLAGGIPNYIYAACELRDYDNPEQYQQAISECQKEIDARMGAQQKNKEDLSRLEENLKKTEKLLLSAEKQIKETEGKISEREERLQKQKEILFEHIRRSYIRQFSLSPFLVFFASTDAVNLARELSFWQMSTNENKKIILGITQDLEKLSTDKEAFKKNKIWLASTKASLDRQAKTLRTEIGKVEGFFSEVTGKIAQLSARQQQLLAARSGTFTTSVGEVPISVIPCSGPPGSPSFCDPGSGNWFAAFSFGAWTHRKGLSQYGAKGRAEAGQNANQILERYFGRTPVAKDTSGTISVSGYGALDFENYYLLGIAEMPATWHPEALKAQAIAARSYAYRYKIEGRSICTTEACQVFKKSKADNAPSAWRQAVESTRGQVIEGVTTFYSSTSGGYLTTSGWDTTDNQGGPGFASRAWESKAGSPWFYSSWYTQNYTASSAKCGRGHPWLTEVELADILNAWQVLKSQSNDDRILPVTINQCPNGSGGGNPYSVEELRQKAGSLGGAFSGVSSVSVTYGQNGETSSLNFQTNKGGVTISGAEFKQAFNLRAPGFIAIRSPLFNLEKK